MLNNNNVQMNSGYWINFKNESKYEHIMGGENKLKKCYCPNCKKPFLHILSLDLKDKLLIKLNIPYHWVHLIYCWTCNISQDQFIYKILSDDEIELLKYKKGGRTMDFPYQNYPQKFQMRKVSLEKIKKSNQETISMINKSNKTQFDKNVSILKKPRTQIGGIPYLVQDIKKDIPICTSCKKPMKLFACISDDQEHNYLFTGNPFVQVLYFICDKCNLIGAIQRCD